MSHFYILFEIKPYVKMFIFSIALGLIVQVTCQRLGNDPDNDNKNIEELNLAVGATVTTTDYEAKQYILTSKRNALVKFDTPYFLNIAI